MFQVFFLSVRHVHRPGHFLQRRCLGSDQADPTPNTQDGHDVDQEIFMKLRELLQAQYRQRRKLFSGPGVSQDVIYNAEGRRSKKQILVDMLQDSKRPIKELCNVELYELGETVKTTCLRHSKEGIVYCVCGECLMPSPEQTERIKNRISASADPLYVVNQSTPWTWRWAESSLERQMPPKRQGNRIPIAKNWKDVPEYRETKQVHGWTLEYRISGVLQHSRH